MPTTPLFDKTGSADRHHRPAGRALRGARQPGPHAPGRGRPAGRPAHGHGTTRRPAARSAAAARSRTARRAPVAPARARARRPTTPAAASSSGRSPRSYEQRLPKRMKRSAARGRAHQQVRRRRHQGRQRPGPRGHQDPPAGRATSRRSTSSGRVLLVEDGKNERLELSARNLPGVTVIRSDSLNIVDVLAADAIVITAPVHPDHVGGVRMTLEAAQVVLRPVISEKSMDQHDAQQVHVRGRRRRQQAADQGRRRGALQGHRAGRQRR